MSVSASQCHGRHAEGFHVGRASLTGGQPRCGQEQDSGQIPPAAESTQRIPTASQVIYPPIFINPFNAKATYVQSTRMQRFLKTI